MSSIEMTVQRAAVIGAGAAGLTMARHLAPPAGFSSPCSVGERGSNVKIVPTVFEMADGVGGTWIYNEQTDKDMPGFKIHSSMYKNLRTNLPKEVMAFPDFPFSRNEENRSFITHEEVLQYLEHYCLHFNLEKFIRFGTVVEQVEPVTTQDGVEKWIVTSRESQAPKCHSEIFDAVIVCNGHYTDPYIPEMPGMSSFKGEIDHSHNYRENSRFADKTVAFLGARASGIDIAIEAAEKSKQVYLCTRYPEKILSKLPPNLTFCAAFDSLTENGVCLTTGENIDVDTVVFCTGYNFHFPFLSPDVKVDVSSFRVNPLYKHVISIHHPTLSFLGLCTLVCPFPQFHQQAAFVRGSLDGSMPLPSVDEMLKDEADDLEYRLTELGWAKRHAHRMSDLQWAYNDLLAEMGNFLPLPKVYKDLYQFVSKRRSVDVLGYRRDNFEITGDDTFRLIN